MCCWGDLRAEAKNYLDLEKETCCQIGHLTSLSFPIPGCVLFVWRVLRRLCDKTRPGRAKPGVAATPWQPCCIVGGIRALSHWTTPMRLYASLVTRCPERAMTGYRIRFMQGVADELRRRVGYERQRWCVRRARCGGCVSVAARHPDWEMRVGGLAWRWPPGPETGEV